VKLENRMASLDPNDPALAELGNWLFSGGGDEQDKVRTARAVFNRLFLPSPPLSRPEEDQRAAFDTLIDSFFSSEELDLQYDLPYPKWEFLRHLTTRHDFLLHGSGLALSELMPRAQDDWSGRPINAVFATSDPIWSIFFATINRAAVNGSIRNGGLLIVTPQTTSERYYFFSVEESGTARQVLQPGYVHLLEREGFQTSAAPVRFDEWHQDEPVRVVKRLPVSIEDFPFRSSIARHPAEPTVASWSNYRKRIPIP
jgi:hypothetical protein